DGWRGREHEWVEGVQGASQAVGVTGVASREPTHRRHGGGANVVPLRGFELLCGAALRGSREATPVTFQGSAPVLFQSEDDADGGGNCGSSRLGGWSGARGRGLCV